MNRKKRQYDLTEEILTALQSSPNLEPCLKFRNADIVSFVKHTRGDKCEQCLYFSSSDGQRIKNDNASNGLQKPQRSMKCAAQSNRSGIENVPSAARNVRSASAFRLVFRTLSYQSEILGSGDEVSSLGGDGRIRSRVMRGHRALGTSSRTALLQALRSFPSIPLPESLRLPVTQLQYLCRIGQPKRLALPPPQYFCAPKFPHAHRCPLQPDLLWRSQCRGHF